MFEISGVSKSFQIDFWKKDFIALSGVSFSVEKSDIVGFLGANGAGKTTLLKILLGFVSPSAGSVSFSEELTKNGTPFEKIGYMPERPYYYTNLTGQEFLEFCGKLSGLNKSELCSQIKYWSERLKIAYALDRKIQSYSKGMLQRLGFASTLLHRPKLLVLDEPLSGLDPIGRRDFKKILLELNQEGITIFFSSHIVSDIEEICKSVVVLEAGKMVYSGNIKRLLDTSEEMYVEIVVEKNEKIHSKFRDYFRYEVSEGLNFKIPKNLQKEFIQTSIELNLNISSLYHNRKTLEEVIYSFKEGV